MRRTLLLAMCVASVAGCNSGSRSRASSTAAPTTSGTAPTTTGTAPTTSAGVTWQTMFTANPATQDDSVRAMFDLGGGELLIAQATGPVRRLPANNGAPVLEGSPGSVSGITSYAGSIYMGTGEPFFVRGGGSIFLRGTAGLTLSLDHTSESMVIAAVGTQLYGFGSQFAPGTPAATVSRLDSTGVWAQDVASLGQVQITTAVAWKNEIWAGGSDKSNTAAPPRLFHGVQGTFTAAPIPSSAGPNEIELVAALLPAGPADFFIATVVVDSLTGFVVRGNVLATSDGVTFATVAGATNDAPVSLAWHDEGLMVGTILGRLYRIAGGQAVLEQIPANNGVMSLLPLSRSRLLVGVRGTTGAQIFSRDGLLSQAAPPAQQPPAAAPKTYVTDVKPVLRNRCAVCHAATGNPAQVGWALSSGVLNDAVDHPATRSKTTAAAPETSLLLTKALGMNHGGGATFASTADPDYVTLIQWIRDGTRLN